MTAEPPMAPCPLIRPSRPGEETAIGALVERVFTDLVAPDYGPEGIDAFLAFADGKAMLARSGPGRILLVAEIQGELSGMIEVRGGNHIALFFAGPQGMGIGRSLFKAALAECRRLDPHLAEMTVNASPYARPVYEKLGFTASGPASTRNGIVFVPMVHALAPAAGR